MSKQVKLRRGTTSEHATFTGAVGEVTVDTTKTVAVVHDGVTAGGVPMAREDRPRGWVKTETFATVGTATWTQTGKTDLKRIRITCYGGGAGGSSGGVGGAGGGGGSGGIGIVTLEASAVTTNVTVTVGGGGAAGASGGSSSFGSYIVSTGGATGSPGTNVDSGQSWNGGAGGTSTGTGVTILGGAGGGFGFFSQSFPMQYPGFPTGTYAGGQGGGLGGGNGYQGGGGPAKGITGSGGGSGSAGSQGSIIVEEIYGLY